VHIIKTGNIQLVNLHKDKIDYYKLQVDSTSEFSESPMCTLS
jgi:hypothetical protein